MERDPRYPIGKFQAPARIDRRTRENLIAQIAAAPAALRAAVVGLAEAELATPYRDGGWTVRQVVHHLPDSHMNAYIRFKFALTESEPTIKPYDEARWAELPEARSGPVDLSLDLLAALHRRWVTCMEELPAKSFDRRFHHPEIGVMSLNDLVALYAWHGRHHTAQITTLGERLGWS